MQNSCEKYKFSKTTLWFTGLSGAGKTTLATAVNERIQNWGYKTTLLDGDVLRSGLNSDLGFSREDRAENIRRFSEVAKLFRQAGVVNSVSVISPFETDREKAKKLTAEDENFIEIFVDCPIEECKQRDTKGLYKKAVSGEIPDFTGISSPYETPLNPDIHIRTDKIPLSKAVEQILSKLSILGIFPGKMRIIESQ